MRMMRMFLTVSIWNRNLLQSIGISITLHLRGSPQWMKQQLMNTYDKKANGQEQRSMQSLNIIFRHKIISYPIFMQGNRLESHKLAYLGAAVNQGSPHADIHIVPDIIRKSGLFEQLKASRAVDVEDHGNISATEEDQAQPAIESPYHSLHILGPLLGRIHHKVASILSQEQRQVLFTMGGDRSIPSGVISGALRVHSDLRVIWVDAHPDIRDKSTPESPLHSIHYFLIPLGHVMGLSTIPKTESWKWIQKVPLLKPENVVMIGLRSYTPQDFKFIKKAGIKVFTVDHIAKFGIGEVMRQTIEHLDSKNQHPFHISFDFDAMDPDLTGQTGYKVRYGLTPRQGLHIVRRLSNQRRVVGMDLSQLDANSDQPYRKRYRGEEHLNSVTMSVGFVLDLIASLFNTDLQF